jgi:hypothetical protein
VAQLRGYGRRRRGGTGEGHLGFRQRPPPLEKAKARNIPGWGVSRNRAEASTTLLRVVAGWSGGFVPRRAARQSGFSSILLPKK